MRRDERGAVLIMVGVFTVVMFAMAAFVVDLGNQRQNRLQLTTATDAAALDVAQQWADTEMGALSTPSGFAPDGPGTWSCDDAARSVVRANNDGLDPDSVSCIAEDRGDFGFITIAASEKVVNQFGGAIGTPEGNTRATTSVKVSAAARGGLRPFAVCANLPGVKEFIASGGTSSDEVTVDALKHLTPECGSASGNWGLLDLDGKGAKAVGGLFANGYGKTVVKSSASNECKDTTPESCFPASPGAKWNSSPIESALKYLDGGSSCETGGPEFFVPTYEEVLDPSGSNAKFPLTGFLRVQLMCFTVGGSNLNSFSLRLVSYDADECCAAVSATNRILEICDVGTIGGAMGTEFESSCGTLKAPPPVGEGCYVKPIDPDKRDVIVDGGGFSIPPLKVDVTVDDATKCGPLGLRAVVHDIGQEVVAPPPSKSGNTYTFTFPASTYFATGGTTLTFEVFEDDFVWDQSATVRTKLDDGSPEVPETCELVKIVSAPTKVNLVSSSKLTAEDAKWVLEFKTPSNCGTLKGMLHYSSGGNAHTPTGDVSIGEVGVSSTVTFTLPKGSDLGHNAYWQPKIYFGDGQVATPPLVLFG